MPFRSSRPAVRTSRCPPRQTTPTIRISIRRRASIYEIGAKWEFRDGALAVTGAVYDSTNENELTPDPVDPTQFVQLGERNVKGVEVGIVGKLTDSWEISAGVAKMDTDTGDGAIDLGTQRTIVRWAR